MSGCCVNCRSMPWNCVWGFEYFSHSNILVCVWEKKQKIWYQFAILYLVDAIFWLYLCFCCSYNLPNNETREQSATGCQIHQTKTEFWFSLRFERRPSPDDADEPDGIFTWNDLATVIWLLPTFYPRAGVSGWLPRVTALRYHTVWMQHGQTSLGINQRAKHHQAAGRVCLTVSGNICSH